MQDTISNSSFRPAIDGVDPDLIPKRILSSGTKIPVVGLGTFGSDRIDGRQMTDAVLGAAEVGYRHFDCASVYGNEHFIGQSFRTILTGGVKREDLWITSKVWNDKHDRVAESCEKSLADLQLNYLDLYLVHWPFPNFHPPGCDATSRSADAQPYIHESYMQTWRQMENLVKRGLVRHIGTSNMTIAKLKLLLQDCQIKPLANEMELHPHFQQPTLFNFVLDQEMIPIGYCPIGSPARPDRDRMPEDTVDIEDAVILRIAQNLNLHPATVCVKWAIQRGQIPIPMSVTRKNYLANLRCAITPPLSAQDMADIASIDRNCRLIKGQVFLWKANQSWEDLWDLNGQITPA